MKKINLFISGFLCFYMLPLQAQQPESIIYSNERRIKYFVEDIQNAWIITPSANPDVLSLYHPTKTIKM
jgi:hypothetical protein